MSLEEAVAAKFAAGRRHYGGEWVGESPLYEAVGEAIDLVVYLRLERDRGSPCVTRFLVEQAEWVAKCLQRHAREQSDDGEQSVGGYVQMPTLCPGP